MRIKTSASATSPAADKKTNRFTASISTNQAGARFFQ
jgi:hypothetical protein